MEKWTILFMGFFVLKAFSQDTSDWVMIDCGSEMSYQTAGDEIIWQIDEDFIKTGKNKRINPNSYSLVEQLNTLRVFTQQNKNCYSLPTPKLATYFIRAVFNYGNYDGLSKPPTFDLELDGNKWAIVVTSMTNTVYNEVIYASKGENTSVCLARTKEKQFPFISSLEAWPLPDTMYAGMSRDLAWFNSYRYNYGATEWILGYPVDKYNRVWKPMIPSGLEVVTADFTFIDYTTVDFPPDLTIIQAVEALTVTEKITLPFIMSKTNSFNHVLVYFTEVVLDINATRSFDFYVNNDFKLSNRPEYQNCTGAWANVQSGSTLTVQLRPAADSTMPPIISALEIYTASDPLVTIQTSQDDLDGLAVFISTFEQLEGWSGDPCLPSDTVWQWLDCTGTDPPRVTSINLSGYGLDGPLPDFSQMQALETIDLRNNSLDGPIPDFLGNMPNLKLLKLSDNNFSGDIPLSITNNKKIKYDINGNPSLPHHKGKRTALIIGLAVGLPLSLILIIAVGYFLSRKKRPTPSQGQVTATELGRPQGDETAQGKPLEESVSINVSTEAFIKPSQANGQNMTTGESIPVAENAENTDQNAGNMNQPSQANEHNEPTTAEENIAANEHAVTTTVHSSVVLDMDMDDLEELLHRFGSEGATGRA